MSSKQLKLMGLLTVLVGLAWTSLSTFASTNQLWFEQLSPKIIPNETLPGQPKTLNSYCYYGVNTYVDSNGNKVLAVDGKFFAKNMSLTGAQTGTAFAQYLSANPSSYVLVTGINLSTVTSDLYSYLGDTYQYINATTAFGDITGSVINSGYLARVYFRNQTDISGGELFWYFIAGNEDDSNLASGGNNQMINVISSTLSLTGLTFVKWPCILDTDAPKFTGYNSGEIVNAFVSGLAITIYDWTGSQTFLQTGTTTVSNSTIHYYWNGTYIPSISTIDNQQGVDTGCTVMYVSGTSFTGNSFTGEAGAQSPFNTSTTLFAGTSFNYAAWSSWITTYAGEGSGRVWTGEGVSKLRGYTLARLWYLVTDNGGNAPKDNQILTFSMTGCDYLNQNSTNQTGAIQFTLTLTGFDKVPPYKLSENYTFTSWNGTTDTTWTVDGGSEFSTTEISNFTGWTSGNVDMNFTGSESILVLTGTITGNTSSYLPMTLPLLASDTYSVAKTITFTGNFGSGRFQFIDNPPYSGLQGGANTGRTILSGAQKYAKTNVFHVFWIDRTAPSVNYGTDYASGAGTTNLYLSGNAVGHAGSTKDDEFKVISYTGTAVTPPLVGTWATFLANDDFTAITGNKLLTFNADWSGCLIVRDRAYNTTQVCVQILLNAKDLTFTVWPEGRFDISLVNQDLSSVGKWYFWNTGAIASMSTGNYASSGYATHNYYGTGLWSNVSIPASGNNYIALYKSEGHLSAARTGNDIQFRLNSTGSLIDLTSYSVTFYTTLWFNKFTNSSPSTNSYLVFGDVAHLSSSSGGNDIVGATDLATLNANLTLGTNTPHHRFNYNYDQVAGYELINAEDQAGLIANSGRKGFWHEHLSLGLTASPETTGSIANYPWGN